MTRETHGATLPPLGGRDPARLVARDDVVRWGELHVVTAVFCTAERNRVSPPDLIMSVCLPHQCMRHLMHERVVNGLVCSRLSIRVGKGNDPRTIVAAPSAWRGQTGNASPRAGAPRSTRWRAPQWPRVRRPCAGVSAGPCPRGAPGWSGAHISEDISLARRPG